MSARRRKVIRAKLVRGLLELGGFAVVLAVLWLAFSYLAAGAAQ